MQDSAMDRPESLVAEIENLLQRFTPHVLFFGLLTTLAYLPVNYWEHDGWLMGDWLISYRAGFIRRGLTGEVIFWLSKLTGVNPGIYVISAQGFLYALFLGLGFQVLRKQTRLLPLALLIFSPFVFLFQIANDFGGFRKEIMFFVLIAAASLATHGKRQSTLRWVYTFAIVAYPFVILSHEMLALFLPYLIALYVSNREMTRTDKIVSCTMGLLSIVSFSCVIQPALTQEQIATLHSSVESLGYPVRGTAIAYLDKGARDGLQEVVKCIEQDRYLLYAIIPFVCAVGFLPIRQRVERILGNRLAFFLIALSMLGTVVLAAVAVDWGRFIYVHCVALFFVFTSAGAIAEDDGTDETTTRIVGRLGKKKVLSIILVYGCFWNLSPVGDPLKAFRRPLKIIGGFVKPYAQIAKIALGHETKPAPRKDSGAIPKRGPSMPSS